jgi:hypothetical protein
MASTCSAAAVPRGLPSCRSQRSLQDGFLQRRRPIRRMRMVDDLVELHGRCGRRFAALAAGVGAEQWHHGTPCSEWDVRTLVHHLRLSRCRLTLPKRPGSGRHRTGAPTSSRPVAVAGNSCTPSSPPSGSSAAATCRPAWVSTPPVMTGQVCLLRFTDPTASGCVPSLNRERDGHDQTPASAKTGRIRPAPPVGARNWDPADKPVAGQPQRRRPDRRSGRVPGSDTTPELPHDPRK